ncbi:2965_t:CDS:2 [Dentiscutata erythropus]|uniref:2965_t:CDS:1 n=1 Tax=Dentiscutata erythropus TaxID=1348616 RepID=A0A9N9FRB6_9GLOM|nr:2965_t:CDS:2 [Dentiscutata erythropus]
MNQKSEVIFHKTDLIQVLNKTKEFMENISQLNNYQNLDSNLIEKEFCFLIKEFSNIFPEILYNTDMQESDMMMDFEQDIQAMIKFITEIKKVSNNGNAIKAVLQKSISHANDLKIDYDKLKELHIETLDDQRGKKFRIADSSNQELDDKSEGKYVYSIRKKFYNSIEVACKYVPISDDNSIDQRLQIQKENKITNVDKEFNDLEDQKKEECIHWNELKNKEEIGDEHRVIRAYYPARKDFVVCKKFDTSTDFMYELDIMKRLNVPDKNIIRFLGISKDKENHIYYIVMEFAAGGDLRLYLKNHFRVMNFEAQLRFAMDITKGLNYIHCEQILHADLDRSYDENLKSDIINNNLREKQANGMPNDDDEYYKQYCRLYTNCWETDPEKRPNIKKILQALENITINQPKEGGLPQCYGRTEECPKNQCDSKLELLSFLNSNVVKEIE